MNLKSFCSFLVVYIRHRVIYFAKKFEGIKNQTVDILMFKRGALQRPLLHGSMIGLSAFGLLTSGVFGTATIVSSSYPGVGGQDPRLVSFDPSFSEPTLNSLYDTHTTISQKPRSEMIEYEIKASDTISSIADKFSISQDTIKWSNDLENVNSITPGQKLKILPVSGVAHTVKSGDTLESVGKRYSAEPQAILDFPFNDIPDDFKLKVGQVLIVPDGVPPQKPKPRVPQYIATGPSAATFNAPGGANFSWPTSGGVSQHFAWYHPGVDIANRTAPAVSAADGGEVVVAGWPDGMGYGNRVVIDHGNGYRSLYAHLSNIYVTHGQTVSRGQAIGQMGSTGRSTGTHLHFEMHFKGIAVNPLAILK